MPATPATGIKEAITAAFAGNLGLIKKWAVGSAGLHALLAIWGVFTPNIVTILGLVLLPIWGGLVETFLGTIVGLTRALIRFAGKTAWLPVVIMPLFVFLAYWLMGGSVAESWSGVGDYLTEDGGVSYAGARVGHPIFLIILLPVLFIMLLPLAFQVAWASLVTVGVGLLGLFLGAALSLPPVVVAVGIRLARLAKEPKKSLRPDSKT